MNQEVAETGRQSGSQSGLKNQLTLNLMVHFISPFQATSSRSETTLGFQIEGAVDFLCALKPCQFFHFSY